MRGAEFYEKFHISNLIGFVFDKDATFIAYKALSHKSSREFETFSIKGERFEIRTGCLRI